ncbi:hypothetical protein RB195_003561 [Necator americanus]|uniref:7TM GPCR serpentine receptor class x (Srx) domain-containing protein n=1 Tax=Necator americanus TaxID=51031 RepID=A0ABR1DPW4_NECAM
MTNNTVVDCEQDDHILAAALLAVTGTTGFLINIFVIIRIKGAPLFFGPYMYTCISRLICDTGGLLIYSLWISPLVFLVIFTGKNLIIFMFCFWMPPVLLVSIYLIVSLFFSSTGMYFFASEVVFKWIAG